MPVLVDPEISRQKLRREVERWKASSVHEERGWILLRYDEDELTVEVAFLATVSLNVGVAPLPIVVCAIRLTYDNYDLWPPSLTFIDVFTRQPSKPHVRALQPSGNGVRDVLIDTHPETQQAFFCVPGIREYHTHPQHTGDSWLLYRERGEGSLSIICDRIWRFMARSVVGLRMVLQTFPTWPMQAQLSIGIAQGEVEKAPDQPQQDAEEASDPAQRLDAGVAADRAPAAAAASGQ
jgi:hypothetical protein